MDTTPNAARMHYEDVRDEERRLAYIAGGSDLESAALLGIHKSSFARWRADKGFPPKASKGRHVKPSKTPIEELRKMIPRNDKTVSSG